MVKPGWNLVGSLSEPLPVSSITSSPAGIVTSQFFEYVGAYRTTNTIQSGKACWVKVSEVGELIFSLSPSTLPAAAIQIRPTSEMPPPPPGDASIERPASNLPTEFALEQNYPNPFNPVTVIHYALPNAGRDAVSTGRLGESSYMVSLKVYDVLGRVVATLVDEVQEAGYKSVEWDASGVASAVYFYRMEATSVDDASRRFSQVRKMLLLR